jgi:ketosteroid isomerase-like protein
MTDADPTRVVQAFIAAINRHDLAAMTALMAADHRFVDSRGQAVTGREAMADGWAAYLRMFPDYTIRIDHLLAAGSLVAAFGAASGTYNGKRGQVAANRIVMPAAWRAVVEDGVIREWQVYADWTEGMQIIREDEAAG